MSKVAHYLQEHLLGEVMSSPDARHYFSTDASIFTLPPALVVYPRNENDVRKTARFSWQLAERGRAVPITARGLGTDQSGAALGSGIMLVFPAHMNKIIDFDGKSGDVTIEPGINYGKLQQALHTHYRFLPPFPASLEYSTVGGAIANNAGGEKSVKYGSTRKYVKRLRVVLANGEVIETKRLNKRELNKKLGLDSMEGSIYRQLDSLLEENIELVEKSVLTVTKNSSGYDLASVKTKGGFDLTPLFVGSQGTLGIVTEATLGTEQHNPSTTLVVAFFDDVAQAQELMTELMASSELPSAIEMVDDNLLRFVESKHPTLLSGIIESPFQKITLMIEYDATGERNQKKGVKKAVKLLKKNKIVHQVETDPDNKEKLWKIRDAASAIIAESSGSSRPLPVIEDGVVPPEKFEEYLANIYKLFEALDISPAVWGHAGNAHFHLQPLLDLAQVGDRQKMFKLADEYYNMVINLGGSITGQHGDGRLRGPYVPKLFGTEVYKLFQQVKKIFDPHNTLNPGVKIDVTLDDIKPLLRQEYNLSHFYDHLPRT